MESGGIRKWEVPKQNKGRKQQREGSTYPDSLSACPALSPTPPAHVLVHFILMTAPWGRFYFKPIFQLRKWGWMRGNIFSQVPRPGRGRAGVENQSCLPPKLRLQAEYSPPTHAVHSGWAPSVHQAWGRPSWWECEALGAVRLSTFVREAGYPHIYMQSLALQSQTQIKILENTLQPKESISDGC